ncbi:MAG: hypothetical protein E7107_01325 [Prevotella sp.]|nr:hypothetical protein [Prevotella sp.]
MIGLAALAFASCAKHDFETMTQEQIVKAEYDAKFVAAFGQPASNQNWGFGSASTRAVKPVYASDNYAAYSKTKPSGFTDAIPSSRKPTMPTNFYNTRAEVIAAGIGWPEGDEMKKDNEVVLLDEAYFEREAVQAYKEYIPGQMNKYDNSVFYIDGNVTKSFSTKQESGKGATICVTTGSTLKLTGISQYTTIYLAPGATLDLTDLDWTMDFLNECAIYMNSDSEHKSILKANNIQMTNGGVILNQGGEIDVDNLTLDGNCVLWNEGSLDVEYELATTNNDCLFYNGNGYSATVGSMDVLTDRCVVYNNGDFTCEGALALTDGASEFANGIDGTLKAASVDMASTSLMYNAGTAIVYGMTMIENKTNKWLNEGSYTSGDFEITGFDKSGTNVWNNCKLIVTATGTGMTGSGNFHLNRGSIILEGGADAGSMLVCDSFTWEDTSGFYLGSKSMVNVIGNIYTDNYNEGYGFYGIGQERSVVKAASITKSADNQYSMSYFGNLYVDIDDHFEQSSIDPWGKQLFYHCDETVKFGNESDSPVYIKPSNCNEGYGTEKEEEFPEVYEGRIMAEDLTVATNSDWDFNDVVFDWTIKDGKAYINLLAAGGTLPIRVGGYRNDDSSEPIGSIEIHSAAALGGYMVNTGVNVGKTSAAFVLDDHTYADHDGNDILITVYKGGSWVEITAEQGEPAGKFNAPVDTDWCEEYANIKKVYTNFAAWVQNTEVEWAVNPTAKYVDYLNVEENRTEAAE